jgi:hypothetical protein
VDCARTENDARSGDEFKVHGETKLFWTRFGVENSGAL